MQFNYHSSLRSLSSLFKKVKLILETHYKSYTSRTYEIKSLRACFFPWNKICIHWPCLTSGCGCESLADAMDFTITQLDLKNDLLLIPHWGLGTSLRCHLPPWLSGMNLHADCRASSLHYFPLFLSSLPSPFPNPPARGARKRQEVFVFPWILPSRRRLWGATGYSQAWARTCN